MLNVVLEHLCVVLLPRPKGQMDFQVTFRPQSHFNAPSGTLSYVMKKTATARLQRHCLSSNMAMNVEKLFGLD